MGFPRLRSMATMVWFMLVFVITCMLYSLNGPNQQDEPHYTNVQQHGRQPRALTDTQMPRQPIELIKGPKSIQRHSHVSLESGEISMNKEPREGGPLYHAAVLPDEEAPSQHHAAMLEEIDGFNYFVEWEHKLEHKDSKPKHDMHKAKPPVIRNDNLPNNYNSQRGKNSNQRSYSNNGPQRPAIQPPSGSDNQRQPNVIAQGGQFGYPQAPGYRTEKGYLVPKQESQGTHAGDGRFLDQQNNQQQWDVPRDRSPVGTNVVQSIPEGTNVVHGIPAPGLYPPGMNHPAPPPVKNTVDLMSSRNQPPETHPPALPAGAHGPGRLAVDYDEVVIKPLPLEQASWSLEEIERGVRHSPASREKLPLPDHEPPAANDPLLYNSNGSFVAGGSYNGQPHIHDDPSSLVKSMSQRAPLPKVKHRVYIEMMGRLGNNMFQFASLYGIARTTRRIPALPIIDNQLLDVFHLDIMKQASFETVPLGISKLQEEQSGIYTPQLFYLPPRDVTVCCYLQSWRYFRDYGKDIRKLFRFKDWVEVRANRYLSVITRNYLSKGHFGQHRLTYVGVHIRRSDYMNQEHLARGYKPASVSYLHKAMDYFRQKYPNVYFIVCSDEIFWAKQHIKAYDVHFVEDQGSTMDLALLTHCNHTVITVGSYGWWAGWLAGGDVVYYKDWPAPGTEIGSSYKHEDYFPPYWKGIGD